MSSRILSQPTRAFIFRLPQILSIAHLPEVAILVVAAVTRFWRLGYHSFWFDEIVSLIWASAGAAYTWETTFTLVEEKHPPGYYLSLHYWLKLLDLFGLGSSDIALRILGSLLGVLTVMGVLLLATRLSGRRTGLLAGLLVALSPALVWYSQELRMFQPAATAIVWGIYFLVRIATDGGGEGAKRRRGEEARGRGCADADDSLRTTRIPLLNTRYTSRFTHHVSRITFHALFILSLTYALYSYLFAAFALPGIGLSLLVLSWQQGRFRWRIFGEGVLSLGIVTALFLPLARNAWLVNQSESPPGQLFGDFTFHLWRQLRIFTIWRVDWPELLWMGALLLFALLLLAGLLLPGRRPSPLPERPLLLLWIALPLLIAGALQAINANVLKEDRYFLFLTPFVLWTIARGAVTLAQRLPALGWGSGLLSVLLLGLALPTLWTPPLYRENWRAAAAYIAEYQEQSSAMPAAAVIHADYLHRALHWYLAPAYPFEELPIYQIFNGAITNGDMETIIPRLAGIEKSGAETLWLVQSHLDGVDEERLVQGWLSEHYPVITEQFPAGIHMIGYALRTRYEELPALAAQATYPAAELAPGVVLAACEITTAEVSATDEAMHPPNGWVHVRLWWQVTGAVERDYRSMIHILGPEGIWGQSLPRDGSLFDHLPMQRWEAGHFLRDEADVILNPATPGNRQYKVEVTLQDEKGKLLPQSAACGEVRVR
jgi:4-amino-4-deoxy-L-arabinose transferase-like glycosyltransferase